jgi:hypothetical protein
MGSVFLGHGVPYGSSRSRRSGPSSPPRANSGRASGAKSKDRQVPPFCTAEVLDADPDHVTPYLVVDYIDGDQSNRFAT